MMPQNRLLNISDKRADIFRFKTVKSSTYSRYGLMNNLKRIPWRKTTQQSKDYFEKKKIWENEIRTEVVVMNFTHRFDVVFDKKRMSSGVLR